jgi:hypothetical protein
VAGSDGDQWMIDYYFSVLRAARGSRWSLRRAHKSHTDELSDVYAGTGGSKVKSTELCSSNAGAIDLVSPSLSIRVSIPPTIR